MPRKPNARVEAQQARRAAADPLGHSCRPRGLQLTGDRLKLWNDVRGRWVLEPASESMLRNACEALERAAQYADQVERDSGTFVDRFGGIRVNPAANLERDFRGLASRTLHQLATRLEGG